MKKMVLMAMTMLALFTTNVFAQEVQNGAKIEFDKEFHDYGTVQQGGDGHCTFTVTNTGNAPLIISQAKGSCQCTVPSWPKEPIAPGASATIKVKYNTQRAGAINKSVTITSNAINTPAKVIRIKGNVIAKPAGGAPVNEAGPASK